MSRMYLGPQKMLLCVDDSPMILEFERRLFEQSGYIVVTVDSARRALRLATSFSFDAVLLDYHMPEMNGHNVASEIRRLRPDTRVVMVSGGVVPEETTRLVDAVVPKDDASRKLLPTVDRLCGLSPT
jgi:two-component system cell cycle sensor histidine kinase/response regulator CckA